jgi:hypothetical protein
MGSLHPAFLIVRQESKTPSGGRVDLIRFDFTLRSRQRAGFES